MASKRRKRREAERKGNLDRFTLLSRKCYSKQAFFHRADAEYNMARLMESKFYDGRELNVYICPLSEKEDKPHYHFGHV